MHLRPPPPMIKELFRPLFAKDPKERGWAAIQLLTHVKNFKDAKLANVRVNPKVLQNALIAGLRCRDEIIRSQSATYLGENAKRSNLAKNVLMERLTTDKSAVVRGRSALALGSLEIKDKNIRDTLVNAFDTPKEDRYVRQCAIYALGELGIKDATVKGTLERASTDRDELVCKYALQSSKKLGFVK